MRKSPKETVTLRLDPVYRAMLMENAKERDMTVTEVVRQMLNAYFRAWRKCLEGRVSDKEIDKVLGKVDNRTLEALSRGEIE